MTEQETESKNFLEHVATKLQINDPATMDWIRRRSKLDKEYKSIKEFIKTARESLDCLEIKLENFYYESVLEGEVDNGFAR